MISRCNPIRTTNFGARYSVRAAKGPDLTAVSSVVSGVSSLMGPHNHLLGSSLLATGISSIMQTPVEVNKVEDPK